MGPNQRTLPSSLPIELFRYSGFFRVCSGTVLLEDFLDRHAAYFGIFGFFPGFFGMATAQGDGVMRLNQGLDLVLMFFLNFAEPQNSYTS